MDQILGHLVPHLFRVTSNFSDTRAVTVCRFVKYLVTAVS